MCVCNAWCCFDFRISQPTDILRLDTRCSHGPLNLPRLDTMLSWSTQGSHNMHDRKAHNITQLATASDHKAALLFRVASKAAHSHTASTKLSTLRSFAEVWQKAPLLHVTSDSVERRKLSLLWQKQPRIHLPSDSVERQALSLL